MKRMIMFAAAIILAASLAGCDVSNGKVKNSPTAAVTPTMTIHPSKAPKATATDANL